MTTETLDTNVTIDVATKSHVKYPSIEQFRSAVKQVRDQANWNGIPLPKLMFRGTVKLHGTNASIATNKTDLWYQSRERIIDVTSDNAGFAQYATFHNSFYADVLAKARVALDLTDSDTKVAIYGEWCGGNIQAGVGINGLDKMFVVLGISYGEEDSRKWLDAATTATLLGDPVIMAEHKCYSIYDFETYIMEIDFANPEAAQNKLVELTIAVETECPVAKKFGKLGIGEGIVWTVYMAPPCFAGIRFKVKGEKHSASKVKVLAEVDPVKVANVQAFVDLACTENRMAQMRAKLTEMELDPEDIRNVGTFLKYVGQDIIKEESDTLETSGLNSKDVMGKISLVARNWYIAKIGETITGKE